MSYLTANPGSVTAVDLSPAHVALNRLKLAAAAHLPDHEAFYDFFGHADRKDNITRFDSLIAPHLDEGTRAYWNEPTLRGKRKMAFARGFYRTGLLGRFIGAAHVITRLGGVDFSKLLQHVDADPLNMFWPPAFTCFS